MTAQQLVDMARADLAANDVDATLVVSKGRRGSFGPGGSFALRIDTELVTYVVEAEPPAGGRGVDRDRCWLHATAHMREPDEDVTDWLPGGDMSKRTWQDIRSAIVEHEATVQQEQEFAAGWDSAEEAHGARLMTGFQS